MAPVIADVYQRLMQDESLGYGFGDHWRPAWPLIADGYNRSFLDVGTGRGESVKQALAAGMRAKGCDIAPTRPDIDAVTLPRLPYADREFDAVGCFDVLEHLPQADVLAAIAELRRVAACTLIISIATIPDKRFVPGLGSVELHLTQQPLDWWLAATKGARLLIDTPKRWRHYIAVPVAQPTSSGSIIP